MELIWPEAPAWRTLQTAIAPALDRTHRAAGAMGTLTLQPGPPDGPLAQVLDTGLALHPALLGPEMFAPADAAWREAAGDPTLAALALDRWRRAAGLIVEGLLLHELARRLSVSPASAADCWWLQAQVAAQTDTLDPELGWLWPDTVDLLRQPAQDQRTVPRRLAWLARWLQARGTPLSADLTPPVLLASDWAAFGAWCRDPAHGPAAQAPFPLPVAAPASAVPLAPAPMSLHPIHLRAGPAGLRLGAHAAPDHLPGDSEAVVVLGFPEAPAAPPSPGRPSRVVGNWALLAGTYGQRTGGARGVEFSLGADGQVEITLANAFVGPLSGDALSLASQFGASGFGGGRWQVTRLDPTEGTGELILRQLSVDHLTIHPRKGLKFALPGQGWQERLRGALARLNDRPMRFLMRGDELILSCMVREDAELVLRFQRA